jgi:hypothetical protein
MGRLLRSLLVAAALFILHGVGRAGLVFEPATIIEDEWQAYAFESDIVMDGDTIYVVWRGWRSDQFPTHIYFSKSTDRGRTWSENVEVSDPIGGRHLYPCIDIDGVDNLYVIWGLEGGVDEVYFTFSTDGGSTWSDPIVVNDHPTADAHTPSMVVDSEGNVYVVYTDNRDDIGDVYFMMSTDQGESWSTSTRVNEPTSGFQSGAVIEVDGDHGRICVIWDQGDIFASVSIDSGQTWSQRSAVNDLATPGTEGYPDIALSGGILHAIWEYNHRTYSGIHYSRSVDGGQTWDSTQVVDQDTNFHYSYSKPTVAALQGSVYAVWDAGDGDDQNYHTYLKMSDGSSFDSSRMRIDEDHVLWCQLPSVWVDHNEEIFVVYPANFQGITYAIMHCSRGIDSGPFIRGDATGDGLIQMGDAITTLQWLYVPGSPEPACKDGSDADDSGEVDMADAAYLLQYLYVPGSPEPPPPCCEYPTDCGDDPTPDRVSCAVHPCPE